MVASSQFSIPREYDFLAEEEGMREWSHLRSLVSPWDGPLASSRKKFKRELKQSESRFIQGDAHSLTDCGPFQKVREALG